MDEQKKSSEINVDYKDAWMRVRADYENLQKEAARKQEEFVKFANENLLTDLISVIEHFHQGLRYIPEDLKNADWMVGFTQIKKQLDEFMQRQGLERIETTGQKFDPQLHEAVDKRQQDGVEPDTVILEVMGGYKLNGKLIQPAKVIIAE